MFLTGAFTRDEKIKKTQEERDESLEQVEQFREWAQKTLFSTRGDGSSSTIMLVPHGRPGANYRDAEPSPARYDPSFISIPDPGADGFCW
jgi:hypothetical protein